ncbi:MAG TPA: glycoside hydrolase, partial [Ruminococcus sp.]|nr:glycoside hydrolase [Ruminococcus sp.]
MNRQKIMTVACSLLSVLSFFTGCKKVENADSLSETVTEEVTETETSTLPVETYPEYPVTYPEIKPADTGVKYQSEDCNYENFKVDTQISGFEGTGYITGFSNKKQLDFKVNAPTNQHYDLTFCISATSEVLCCIQINGKESGQFHTNSEGKFTRITMHGVFLTEGNSTVSISSDGGEMAVDYLEISNNTSLKDIEYDTDVTLSNTKADKSAKELMKFLSDNYGKYVISGQYASDNTNSEIDLIYSVTGKKPVIRFSALETSYASYDESFKDIDACAEWYREGGIVGLMWYWRSPDENASVYANETDFRISKAVTDIDISCMTQEEIRGLYGEGKISKECYGMILDIDNMAGQLMSLKDKGIPVLWRPLHEAS